jgi:uncharacterized protein (TIGR00251 family)
MYLKVTVFPDFKKEHIEKISEDTFKVYIRESPERGMANKRVIKIFSEIYKGKQIKIVNGHLQQKKLIEIK